MACKVSVEKTVSLIGNLLCVVGCIFLDVFRIFSLTFNNVTKTCLEKKLLKSMWGPLSLLCLDVPVFLSPGKLSSATSFSRLIVPLSFYFLTGILMEYTDVQVYTIFLTVPLFKKYFLFLSDGIIRDKSLLRI